jgi:hypothetical protein
LNLDDIAIPSGTAAAGALDVATAYASPALLNHSIRAYLWAAGYGNRHGVMYDRELLYVAALLHDIGLTAEFDSHTVAFEEAGGHLAWVFATGAGWPVARRNRLLDIIVLHMRDDVPATADPEAHLLQIAVSLDVSGRRPDAFPDAFKEQVLSRYPRQGFGAEFLTLCAAQADRKPDSAAAALIRDGIAGRVAANPLDRPNGRHD